MYSCHKNSYIQGNFKDINAGLINRCVQRAWDGIANIDEHDLDPPFQRLTSEQPNVPVKNVDPTRRPEGFGRIAMPILRRDLHNKNIDIVIAALTSISDLVHDPERCYEAIRLKIVDRLVDLVNHEIPAIRERSTLVLKIIAGQALGKEAIIRNESLLSNLLENVEDEYTEVRLMVAACLKELSVFWKAADVLVEFGFIPVLLTNLTDEEEIVEIHLDTLSSLLYCDGKKVAIEEEGFQTLIKLFDRDEGAILAKTCEVIVRLCMIKEGRNLAQQFNLLSTLNRLLHDERVQVHTAAAQALMFCTIKSSEKIAASKIKNMPKRLVQLSKQKFNNGAQMYAIKALTCICEHPAIRKEVSEKYYNDVKSIQVNGNSPEIRQYKNTLLTMMQWVPQSKE